MKDHEPLFSQTPVMIGVVSGCLVIVVPALISLIISAASYHYGDVFTAQDMLSDAIVGGSALLVAIFEFNYWLKIKLSKKK